VPPLTIRGRLGQENKGKRKGKWAKGRVNRVLGVAGEKKKGGVKGLGLGEEEKDNGRGEVDLFAQRKEEGKNGFARVGKKKEGGRVTGHGEREKRERKGGKERKERK
jgi:hypothetical protein